MELDSGTYYELTPGTFVLERYWTLQIGIRCDFSSTMLKHKKWWFDLEYGVDFNYKYQQVFNPRISLRVLGVDLGLGFLYRPKQTMTPNKKED